MKCCQHSTHLGIDIWVKGAVLFEFFDLKSILQKGRGKKNKNVIMKWVRYSNKAMGDSQGVEVTEHSILFQSKLLTAEAIPAADSCNLNHCAFHLQDSRLEQHRLLD